jgi:hypothetical protein
VESRTTGSAASSTWCESTSRRWRGTVRCAGRRRPSHATADVRSSVAATPGHVVQVTSCRSRDQAAFSDYRDQMTGITATGEQHAGQTVRQRHPTGEPSGKGQCRIDGDDDEEQHHVQAAGEPGRPSMVKDSASTARQTLATSTDCPTSDRRVPCASSCADRSTDSATLRLSAVGHEPPGSGHETGQPTATDGYWRQAPAQRSPPQPVARSALSDKTTAPSPPVNRRPPPSGQRVRPRLRNSATHQTNSPDTGRTRSPAQRSPARPVARPTPFSLQEAGTGDAGAPAIREVFQHPELDCFASARAG